MNEDNVSIVNNEDLELTSSFPYMLLVSSFLVLTVLHLIIMPLARDFAHAFALGN